MHGPQIPSIPRLQYHLSSPSSSLYGWITVGGEQIHRIANFDEFYWALGYTEEIRRTGLAADEFLWERYRRDGAVKSEQCLQIQIATYLYKHSAKFKAEFGREYDEMSGKCISDCIDNDDAHCVDCPMHPRFAY
ncbi:MAG: hypothetical protein M0Q22_08730 [Sulfuritalea sp.]|jgi:hypothetical protein|nr:hypothetical protein [Sulfuritalea sp.]